MKQIIQYQKSGEMYVKELEDAKLHYKKESVKYNAVALV
jgi:hypothetical protein